MHWHRICWSQRVVPHRVNLLSIRMIFWARDLNNFQAQVAFANFKLKNVFQSQINSFGIRFGCITTTSYKSEQNLDWPLVFHPKKFQAFAFSELFLAINFRNELTFRQKFIGYTLLKYSPRRRSLSRLSLQAVVIWNLSEKLQIFMTWKAEKRNLIARSHKPSVALLFLLVRIV